MPEDRFADSLPPHSPEAEQAILGAMLLDPQAVPVAQQFLKAEAFYNTAHQRLFALLTELYAAHGTVDPVLVAEELSRRGLLEVVGGKEALADLMNAVASSANAEHYARVVREKAVLRGLIHASRQIAQDAHGGESCELVVEKAQRLIFDLASQNQARQSTHIGDALKDVFRRLENIHDASARIEGVSSGFADLDDLTGGLHEDELIIVAGRPSMGKTSFALSLAHNVAMQESRPGVAIFSMEQTAAQVAEILACAHARVRRDRLRKGMLGESEMQTLLLAAGALSDARIYIDDTPGMSLAELRTKARHLKSRFDIRLIVLDYIQLMESPLRRADGRQQEISDISRGLKAMARELRSPVVALSQLNRLVESREGHRPRLSDLRESGSLEQDADAVMLLYRSDYYDRGADQSEVCIDLAKQRNGPVGEIKLAFIRDYQRFENFSRHESVEEARSEALPS